MAETERDEQVSAGYRALGSEEPPRALDDAILAAARRSPTRWRVPHARWRIPLSIAAVLVLAVGVTLRMLPQQPDAESVALAPRVMETPRPKAPAQAAAPAREQNRPDARAKASAEVAIGVAPSPMRSEVAAKLAKTELAPQAWLARIAELRKEGRKREADESLAEFRKRYPDTRIPEALR